MAMVDRYTIRALALLRAVNGLEAENASVFLALSEEIRAILGGVAFENLSRAKQNALIALIRKAVSSAYETIAATNAAALPILAQIEAVWATGGGAVPRVASAEAIAAATRSMLVQGSPLAELWARASESLTFRIAAQVRTAAVAATPAAQVVKAVVGDARTLRGGMLERARIDAAGITDTAAHTAAYAGRLATFKAQGMDALEFFNQMDTKTTIGCAVRAGKFYTLDLQPLGHTVVLDRPPPRHYRCRSIMLPHKFINGQPPPSIKRDTFKEWLAKHSEEDQNTILGKRRADLWRAGKITLPDLIGQRGQILLLADLAKLP